MNHSRRRFLKTASLLGAAGSVAPLTVPFWSSRADAQVTDYKALVCVFLYGANDNGNTLIPTRSNTHAAYLAQRGGVYTSGGVGIPLDKLADTTLKGGDYALNPAMKRVRALYNQDRCAIVTNVGPLIEPTVLVGQELRKKSDPNVLARLPPKLRSHNDQQAFWQSLGTEGSATGWGGRFADPFVRDQSNPAGNAVFSSISTFGSAVFNSGAATVAYQVGPTGSLSIRPLVDGTKLFGLDPVSAQTRLRKLLTRGDSNRLFERDLNALRARSIGADATLSLKLDDDAAYPAGQFDSELGAQLGMVLRLINAGRELGLKRQVFHVGMGGFDMHDGLIGYDVNGLPLAGTQGALLSAVDDALGDFQAAVTSLGLAPNVTTFTASDFGRTINPNNDGSDHAWGSHHFVLGGAVNGGQRYGVMPDFDPADPAWMTRGVLMPTTATQQLAFTLGRWFDVPNPQLIAGLPGIENFAVKNLGFMT